MKTFPGSAIYFLCVVIGFAQPGTIDPTFDAGSGPGDGSVEVVREMPNGEILVGGTFTTWNGIARQGLVRLQNDGSLDLGFQFQESSDVSKILVHESGVYAGHSTLYRLLIDGARDTNFSPIPLDNRSGTVALAGDKIYTTAREPHRYRAVLDRWSLEGELEGRLFTSCCPGESITVAEAAPDGSVFLGGLFVPMLGESVRNLARITPSGLDKAFAPEVAQVIGMARGDNGDLYVVHGYGNSESTLQKFTAAGALDTNFVATADYFTALAVQHDGKLIYAGPGVKRLNADGTLDLTFTSDFAQGNVRTLAVQADGRILAGGNFTNVNGVLRNGVVRLLADGPESGPSPLPEGLILNGRVTDGVNGVAGVTMRLKKQTTLTDENGEYSFAGLEPGRYVIRPRMPGGRFKPQFQRVSVSEETSSVDFLLKRTRRR